MENGRTLVLGLAALCLVGQMGSNNGIEPVQVNMEDYLAQENQAKKEFVIVELAAQVFIRKQNYLYPEYVGIHVHFCEISNIFFYHQLKGLASIEMKSG